MKNSGLVIGSLDTCIALNKGIKAGDRILEVNGHPIRDELDWRFHAVDSPVDLKILDGRSGITRLVELDEDECLGLSFPPMKISRCRNRCIFCFVDQLPCGLRETLYVKDEDYRFSFLYGNYVTLASVHDEELERICRMRLSPMYVSVHATDPGVRNTLLGRKQSRDIMQVMKRLATCGIQVHTQIVLCPGVNDGAVLERTIEDLAGFHPAVASVAVVPVGLTRFRKRNRLVPLRAVGRKDAVKIVAQVEDLRIRFGDAFHEPFLFLADEFYWKAGMPFPSIQEYGDLPQLENGVGMVAIFNERWRRRRRRKRKKIKEISRRRCVAITGVLAFPVVLAYVEWLREGSGMALDLIPVRNDFFGRCVNVAGLITGRDVVKQVRGHVHPGDLVLVPEVMLDDRGGRFLDDITLGDLERTLGVEAASFPADPEGFETALGLS